MQRTTKCRLSQLSITLFKFHLQANKLHIRDQEKILNKIGYMHIIAFLKKISIFFSIGYAYYTHYALHNVAKLQNTSV